MDGIINVRDGDKARSVEELTLRIVELEGENAHLNLQLAVMSSTDIVTGLANRTGIVDAIEVALSRQERMKEPFAVVGVRFPELAGLDLTEERIDAVRDLGAFIAASLRNVDRVGRIDDTTFVVVLADVPPDHVSTVTLRTRAMVRALPGIAGVDFELSPTLVAVSVAGVATPTYVADVFEALEDLLHRTDESVLVI
jgi:GGDEF domain-containing protein